MTGSLSPSEGWSPSHTLMCGRRVKVVATMVNVYDDGVESDVGAGWVVAAAVAVAVAAADVIADRSSTSLARLGDVV